MYIYIYVYIYVYIYIYVIISNNRMCTGACLRAAARHWAQLGLGPGAHAHTALPAELAPAAPVARRSPRTRLPRRRRLHVCT